MWLSGSAASTSHVSKKQFVRQEQKFEKQEEAECHVMISPRLSRRGRPDL